MKAWKENDEEEKRMKRNLVSINEISQQEALKILYSRDIAEVRKEKIARLRRVALVYNPAVCRGFVCVYWFVGLGQYNAAI